MSTDKRIMSKTTYGKNFKSLSNLTDLIRSRSKPKTELEIENLVVKDMKRKILQDEMNEMQFYDIQAIDTGNLSQGISKYRSTHIFSDMALIRGTKFYQKPKFTDLEKQLRSKLAHEPGYLLLLKEIYARYEENQDKTVNLKLKRKEGEMLKNLNQFKQEKDQEIVSNLDLWQKEMKRKQEEQKKKQEDEG